MQSSFDINLNLYYGAQKGKMLKNDHSLLYNESQNLLSSKMLKQALQKCAIFNQYIIWLVHYSQGFCSRMIALSQSETHSPTVFSLLKYIILFNACERWTARLSRFWIQLWCSSHKVFRGLGIWHMKVWTTHMALCILFEAENHTGLEGHESE